MRVCCAGRADKPRGCPEQGDLSQHVPGAKQDPPKCSCEQEKEEAAGGDTEELSRELPMGVHKGWGLRSVARPGPSSHPGGTLPKLHKTPVLVVVLLPHNDLRADRISRELQPWTPSSGGSFTVNAGLGQLWVTQSWNQSR